MAHLLNIIVSTVVICLCIECMQLNINAMDEKWNGMEWNGKSQTHNSEAAHRSINA